MENKAYSVHVLFNGYSSMNCDGKTMNANCTCTLIKGPKNVIIDTMTAWDRDNILKALREYDISPEDIDFVISTHGHSDHIGNNNLFVEAERHIVGFSISQEDIYYIHPFENGTPYTIDECIEIIPTPGHTMSDISVIVKQADGTVYAVTGDLFENENDVVNPSIWLEAGSESPELQRSNRFRVAQLSDWIIPGHGHMFRCTDQIRKTLESQVK